MNVENINFTGKYAKNEKFGINVEVVVTQRIIIQISQETLQDIEPENRYDSAEEQFNSNRIKFEKIAEEKIRNLPDIISISSADILK
ncbi:hypothetical protein [Acinetobacter sp. YH12097]|uniref:hypothetical protein n=1 Tax=Acinetobacter sp. YH12097 TaxID=2601086 RepID=UPI0015D16356|nr:hypothetical protein [Acinetobacter sp. YH12097]